MLDALCECIKTLRTKEQQQTPLEPKVNEDGGDSKWFRFAPWTTDLSSKYMRSEVYNVLWAFALIFDSTRTGTDVTATVLRESQHEDPKKVTITLYVAKNCGLSNDTEDCGSFRECKEDLERWVMSPFLDVKGHIMERSKGRISSYYNSAKDTFKNDSRMETYNQLLNWCPENEPYLSFAMQLKDLLKLIWDTVQKDDFDDRKRTMHRAWVFLNNHGATFNELWTPFQSNLTPHPIMPDFDDKRKIVAQYFKNIENFAKLPRAIHVFQEFRRFVTESDFTFKISPIPSESTTGADDRGTKLPHCEMQLLQYFEGKGQEHKGGTWNLIGCSKRPCYCCSFIIKHGSDFTFKDSHGKIYGPWIPPQSTSPHSRLPGALEELNRDLEKKISDISKGPHEKDGRVNPDSPTTMEWPFVRLPQDSP